MLSGFKSRKGRQKCSWFPGLRLLRASRRRLSFVPNGTRSLSYVKPSVKTLGYFLFSLVKPSVKTLGYFRLGPPLHVSLSLGERVGMLTLWPTLRIRVREQAAAPIACSPSRRKE